ncbi:related to cyclin homolog UME3 [Cephalotrichum gorgonifer]|uniref:RNA polymerase II holoenzyme cyclin-like subunit n=1 Tax=Cephalotrichum gorgonifer TaxID=2041049 RepID=A0AAE8N5M9_9PEZI|nr:related to cyclin homolog UME3 [Cephalotrichum gorgonifer]
MSANYWESSQYKHWLFTKEELASMRQKLESENAETVQMFTLPEWRHLYIYFNQQIARLGKRLKIRQQAIATAQVYIKRFYIHIEIRRTNPYLVIATAVYLACKIEECPQHIRLIVSEARSLWQDSVSLDTSRLGECEFHLISEMGSHLIIHQPYRTLTSLQSDIRLSGEDFAFAWSIINDSYMTDLPLMFPPHIVALAAILLTLVMKPNMLPGSVPGGGMAGGSSSSSPAIPNAAAASAAAAAALAGTQNRGDKPMDPKVGRVQKFVVWLADSDVDVAALADCTQEILSFSAVQEQYNDKLTREQISRFVKARGLDK